MFYLIVLVFLAAGLLPFWSEYQARHDPRLGALVRFANPSLLTLDNVLGVVLVAVAVGLLFRRGWARTLGASILLAWRVKYGLLIIVGVVFLEALGGYSMLGLLFAGKLMGSLGDPSAASVTREGMGGILGVLAHPILSRLFIVMVGALAILLLHWAYRYLRDDEAVEWDFGPATLFGRSLRIRGRDLTIPVLAGIYLAVPFLPLLERLPAVRALRPASRRAAQMKKEAEERDKQNWIVDIEWSADLKSLMVFTAKAGAARIDLETEKVQALDPEVFTYALVGAPAYIGTGKGSPEKIRSRVSPDHQWFLNQDGERVGVGDGSRRVVDIGRPLGRPVLFLDARQVIMLTPEGEFLWVELDPDRVTWAGPAPGGQGGELLNRVPLMQVSGPRNALYYEIGGSEYTSHYVVDLGSGEGHRVDGAGKGSRFQVFSAEGDMACLQIRRVEGLGEDTVLVDVKSGAATVVPWKGTVLHVSSTNNLAITEQAGVLRAYEVANPATEVWQSRVPEPGPSRLHVTPDGGVVVGDLVAKSQILWSRLLPMTGPEGWSELPVDEVPGKGEYPDFEIDPTSQMVAWRFGLKVLVFKVQDLAAGGARVRTFDLEGVF